MGPPRGASAPRASAISARLSGLKGSKDEASGGRHAYGRKKQARERLLLLSKLL